MASSDQKASAGVYVTPDVGLEVTDGTYSRVQVGKITTTPTYGIKVLSSDGSTVIIDGTSDMFKIAATGTQSTTEATGNSGATSTVSLPSLGTFTNTPAILAFQSIGSAATNAKLVGSLSLVDFNVAVFVAATSGGAVTTKNIGGTLWGQTASSLDGSNFVQVQSNLTNMDGATHTLTTKYYVLVEAAM